MPMIFEATGATEALSTTENIILLVLDHYIIALSPCIITLSP